MSHYADKLTAIALKKQKLLTEETKLIAKRKNEIGNLAEKFNLLTVSDNLITGIFLEIQTALTEKSNKIKSWEQHGAQFHNPKRNAQEAQASTT